MADIAAEPAMLGLADALPEPFPLLLPPAKPSSVS
jgi:hypothetical protein